MATAAIAGFAKRVAWLMPVCIMCNDRLATIVRVDGASMQPTLNPGATGSEWVLVEKLSYKWLHKYSRGDVAVLWLVLQAPSPPFDAAAAEPAPRTLHAVAGLPMIRASSW